VNVFGGWRREAELRLCRSSLWVDLGAVQMLVGKGNGAQILRFGKIFLGDSGLSDLVRPHF
jgi:hypothetical protein